MPKTNCFICKGHGFVGVNTCITCAGTGHLNSDLVCECSRPAIRGAGDTVVCASDVCYNKAIARIIDKSTTKVVDYDAPSSDTNTLGEFWHEQEESSYWN